MGFKSECTPLPDTTFEWGRTDCPTAPKQLQAFEFPTVDMTRDQMLAFFSREFGFNAQEVIKKLEVTACELRYKPMK